MTQVQSVNLPINTHVRGPFLATRDHSGKSVLLLPVYRLYPDLFRTFVSGVYPTNDRSYRQLRAINKQGYNLIPVPSRLYSRCDDKGAFGQRLGVKGEQYNQKTVKAMDVW